MSIESHEAICHGKVKWAHQTQLAAEWLGFEVILTNSQSAAHDGWACHMLQALSGRGMQYAVLPWGYGGCNRCDDYAHVIFDHDNPDDCYEVFGDLIILCDSEADARDLFDSVISRPSNTIFGFCDRFLDGLRSITFPILRQAYPALIANEIVSVQPMTARWVSCSFLIISMTRPKKQFFTTRPRLSINGGQLAARLVN